ncbi:MAG: AEC family transporter [Verrucomicrobia bacterium]|nr:AEC family transporter [Verrucomicrobiota bacterium]
MLVLNALAPVFLLIALGAWMQWSGFVSERFLREANRVTYYLGLPALLFSQLTASLHQAGGTKLMFTAMLTGTALTIAVAYGVAWWQRVPAAAVGTYVQGAFRGNLAFVGLPIIYGLPDTPVAGGLSARAAAIITVAPMLVIYNTAGVIVLLVSQHQFGLRMLGPLAKQLVTNPPLIGTLAGIAVALTGWPLPVVVEKSFAALGDMALPLGLLGVGGALVTANLGAAWRQPLGAALVKTFAGPALGWSAGRVLGLGAIETKLVMILMATPSATVSYTVALELKGDERIASGAIVLSVVASLVALAVVVGAF